MAVAVAMEVGYARDCASSAAITMSTASSVSEGDGGAGGDAERAGRPAGASRRTVNMATAGVFVIRFFFVAAGTFWSE